MVKGYGFEEFKWHFLAKEVEKFDLRKPYDFGRYMARQSLKESMSEKDKAREEEIKKISRIEEKELKEGPIVKILRFEASNKSLSPYVLKNTA